MEAALRFDVLPLIFEREPGIDSLARTKRECRCRADRKWQSEWTARFLHRSPPTSCVSDAGSRVPRNRHNLVEGLLEGPSERPSPPA